MKLATLAMKACSSGLCHCTEGCILETEVDQKEERWGKGQIPDYVIEHLGSATPEKRCLWAFQSPEPVKLPLSSNQFWLYYSHLPPKQVKAYTIATC